MSASMALKSLGISDIGGTAGKVTDTWVRVYFIIPLIIGLLLLIGAIVWNVRSHSSQKKAAGTGSFEYKMPFFNVVLYIIASFFITMAIVSGLIGNIFHKQIAGLVSKGVSAVSNIPIV